MRFKLRVLQALCPAYRIVALALAGLYKSVFNPRTVFCGIITYFVG